MVVTLDTPSAECGHGSRRAPVQIREAPDGPVEPAVPAFLAEFVTTRPKSGRAGALTPVAIAVGLALLIGFRDVHLVQRLPVQVFPPGLRTPVFALLLVILWRARRQRSREGATVV